MSDEYLKGGWLIDITMVVANAYIKGLDLPPDRDVGMEALEQIKDILVDAGYFI